MPKFLLRIFVVVLIVMLSLQVGRVTAVDESPEHRLRCSCVGEGESFAAEIDGHKFTTTSALEEHLASLQADSVVRWDLYMGHVFAESPSRLWLQRYQNKLRVFCRTHHLKSRLSVSYT